MREAPLSQPEPEPTETIPFMPEELIDIELIGMEDILEAASFWPDVYKIKVEKDRNGKIGSVTIYEDGELFYYLNVETMKKLQKEKKARTYES